MSDPRDLYVGVDIGTSGVRARAVDAALIERARAERPLPPPLGEGPAREQDPWLWWRALVATLGALLERIPADAVRAIAVDGTSSTLLLADSGGDPVGNALMYDDARALAEAERIGAVAPAASAARGASSSLAKLVHLLGRPGARAARYALHQAEWLAGRLSGTFGVGDENNALKLGYDPVARAWPQWLDRVGIPRALLPAVVAPGTPVGEVTLAARWRFGLPAGAQVVAGTTDGVAAFIATGAAAPGEAVTSLGSTLVIKVVSPAPVFDPAHGVYSHRLGDRWLAGGASNAGGATLLQHFSAEELDAMTPRLAPERPTGLDYYPLPRPGERFPVADPALAPRLEPRADDPVVFFQAMLEGLARIERQGYERLAELGAPYPTSVRTVGGGARNEAWRRIRSDLLGVPVSVPPRTDAAYGAALIAAGALKPA